MEFNSQHKYKKKTNRPTIGTGKSAELVGGLSLNSVVNYRLYSLKI